MNMFIGKFRGGVPNGWCVKTFPNGDVYTGTLKNGLRIGFGQYKWVCGDVYTGIACHCFDKSMHVIIDTFLKLYRRNVGG